MVTVMTVPAQRLTLPSGTWSGRRWTSGKLPASGTSTSSRKPQMGQNNGRSIGLFPFMAHPVRMPVLAGRVWPQAARERDFLGLAFLLVLQERRFFNHRYIGYFRQVDNRLMVICFLEFDADGFPAVHDCPD